MAFSLSLQHVIYSKRVTTTKENRMHVLIQSPKLHYNRYDEPPITETILATARQLFQSKGFEQTSLSDLCKEMNIESNIFYNHYGSLDEVLEILWNR